MYNEKKLPPDPGTMHEGEPGASGIKYGMNSLIIGNEQHINPII